ncbi:MAG: type II secretion system F family protein [Oscillospiraceae bacterium]|nr:type II secretion system F family protein [Oscillospiraceae bacterium]
MPKYSYTALDMTNKKVNGEVDARDDEDLRRILRTGGLSVTKYSAIEDRRNLYRLKTKEVGEFSRQIASMLSSGITVVRAMEILKDRDFSPKLLRVYEKLHKDVQMGYTLAEAMQLQSRSFPELFINMYASGEASGQLEMVATKMAEHYDKDFRINAKAKSAMTYPIVLLVTTVAVIMIIFTAILPSFFELFEDVDLPVITDIMIGISQFMQDYWFIVIIALLIFILVWQTLLLNTKVKYQYDRIKLKLPVAGKLFRTIYTARFARTLSSLYSSGIPMIRALEITGTILNSKFLEAQFPELITDVRNGEPLSAAIAKVEGLDRKLAATVMIGEESGRLDSMLESTAEGFDYEAEIAIEKLVQLLQPVMIVILALIILPVILSVMLAMMEIYNNPHAWG